MDGRVRVRHGRRAAVENARGDASGASATGSSCAPVASIPASAAIASAANTTGTLIGIATVTARSSATSLVGREGTTNELHCALERK